MALNDLLIQRTIANMIHLQVLPEVRARLTAGTLTPTDLPLRLFQFRLLQTPERTKVELNDEVHVIVEMPTTRPMQAGEPVTLADVRAEEAMLQRPTLDGRPAAYFLCQSIPITFLVAFDFLPNHPATTPEQLAAIKQHYPVTAIAEARHFIETVDPLGQFTALAQANWPPAPGYYPHVLAAAHHDPASVAVPAFVDTVERAYSRDYWQSMTAFWQETNFFPDRLPYIEKAIERYFSGDYISSIYVLVPHFEGIVRDYARGCGIQNYRFETCLPALEGQVFGREILLFPRRLLEEIFRYVREGSFLRETGTITDPGEQVNRHGIAHGNFTGFESKAMALKYLTLLDALALVLLHDKILTNTL
jgi:hypothetical protein